MENRCRALNVNVAAAQRLRESLEDGGLLHPRLRPRRQESGRLLLPLAEEAERCDWLPLRLALQEAGLAAADESDWPAPGEGLEERGETLARDWWLSSVSAPSLRGPRRRRGRPASSRLLHALRALAARKLREKDAELRVGDVELRGGDELRGNDVELCGKDVELRVGDVELRGGDELRGGNVELRGKDVELRVGDVELCGKDVELRVGDVELWAREVPSRYERHGDLVVLPSGAFRSHYWRQLEPELWAVVARVLGASRVARCHRVAPDDFRSPRTQLLLGGHGHVVHRDNSITYEFDVTLCMFSKGNVSEKLHLASLDCRGETIVDLYAGIGYLTLPLLVHAGAALAVACEWSPHAAAALRHNLGRNGVARRCTVHAADNQTLRERGFADRVLLGLLPSSRPAWALACALLRPDRGGILHIHHNVASSTPTEPRSPTDVTSLPAGHDTKVTSLPAEHSGTEVTSLTADHDTKVTSLPAGHDTKVTSLPADHDTKVTSLPADHDTKVTSLPADHSHTKVTSLPADNSIEVTSLPADHSIEVTSLPAEHDTKVTSLPADHSGTEVTSLPAEHNTKVTSLPADSSTDATSLPCECGTGAEEEEGGRAACACASARPAWRAFARDAVREVRHLLLAATRAPGGQGGGRGGAGGWCVRTVRVARVKKYAPRVDHVVVDLHCRPLT
ncbi:tRNA wybutosine-synthesizing protein 2 homolog [Lethenteron reissneri]|uniref:tRNA wybutosine-synthesizing protein 2 homolog n=1 Tax=Lethenteron reissneri TaxID=7753 RepID=UPI002AB68A9B|nr:tRNA wybutosine-synthesizing protein 2 homolog [Lethenteron reissneri]